MFRPLPFDPARAARIREELWPSAAFLACGCRAACWTACSATARFWAGWRCASPKRWRAYFAAGPDAVAASRDRAGAGRVSPMRKPRRWRDCASAKRRAALAIAMADIAGCWDLDQVTGALTRFADACCQGRVALSAAPRRRRARHGGAGRRRAGSGQRPDRAGDGKIRRP